MRREWLTSIVIAQLSIILIFIGGFFVPRYKWTIKNVFEENQNDNSSTVESVFDRLIIIIVDAMRFDMINPYFSVPYEDSPEYVNRLSFIRQVMKNRPEQSILYRFKADPPTVTTQRLKGMTIGNFPTFLDIGDSFTSEAVSEDNIIYQLINSPKNFKKNINSSKLLEKCTHHRNMWVLGDDTWMVLYPDGEYDSSELLNSMILTSPYIIESDSRKKPIPPPPLLRCTTKIQDDCIPHTCSERLNISLSSPSPSWSSSSSVCSPWDYSNVFPSFFVNDFHTNDVKILSVLLNQVDVDLIAGKGISSEFDNFRENNTTFLPPQPQWDILISHFLGVDHVGHKLFDFLC
jgi:predicted AlkP superfamily pyrophosphatase or phosphodiesterase